METYTTIELFSALTGFVGTLILFVNSYSLQPLEGGVFGSDVLTELNKKIRAKNKKRLLWQRIGFGFLCLSFGAQIVSVLA